MEKTVYDMMLDDTKHVGDQLISKSSTEPISQERMNKPHIPQEKPHSSKEIILDKAQASKETDSLMNANPSDWSESTTSDSGISTRSMFDEKKIVSEIQEEKETLEELKVNMDKWLSVLQELATIQGCPKEDRDDFREVSSRNESYFKSLVSLPSNRQPQTYKNTMENMRGTRNNIRKLLSHLYEAIELTYQSKQGSEDQENHYKALFELWIKWTRSQSENEDGDTQVLEIQTLGMARNIALKLQSAFMDLMSKVQGLPRDLQDKLQQACCDMHTLHTTFSLSNGFKDLEKLHLTQGQFKLTEAQGSIEELFCFLENGIPSGWIVGPLSPSEYPLQDNSLKKKNEM